MTREEAYYERLKLLCGEWDTYDEWLTKHMETENPLSDIVLELIDCRGDMKEVEYHLNLYCQEKPFDEESVYTRIRLKLFERYEKGALIADDVATTLFCISKVIPFCDFGLACGNVSDYYVFVDQGLLDRTEFEFALKEFLAEGKPINVKIMWDKLLTPKPKKKRTLGARLKRLFARFRKKLEHP